MWLGSTMWARRALLTIERLLKLGAWGKDPWKHDVCRILKIKKVFSPPPSVTRLKFLELKVFLHKSPGKYILCFWLKSIIMPVSDVSHFLLFAERNTIHDLIWKEDTFKSTEDYLEHHSDISWWGNTCGQHFFFKRDVALFASSCRCEKLDSI